MPLRKWLLDETQGTDEIRIYLEDDPETEIGDGFEKCLQCFHKTKFKYKRDCIDYREVLQHRLKCKRYQ